MIMILTGKCLKDFEIFLSKNYGSFKATSFQECASAPEYEVFLDEIILPKSVENALIIEFFDSVGYNFNIGLSFIKTKKYKCELYIATNDNILGECYEFKGKFLSIKQIEATEQAIIHANKIYNETKA